MSGSAFIRVDDIEAGLNSLSPDAQKLAERMGHNQITDFSETISTQHYRFCLEYIVDFDHVRAYGAVFSTANPGSQSGRLLNQPKIQKVIMALLRQYSKRVTIDKDLIISRLWQESMSAQKSSDRIKALSEIAKLIGFNNPKDGDNESPEVMITINDPHQIVVSSDGKSKRKQTQDNSAPLLNVSISDDK